MIPPPPYQGGVKTMKTSYVYLIRSLTTNTTYLGWTTDLKRRLDQHNSGKSSYTKSRGPWELVTYETFPNSEVAKKREKTLKRNPRMLFFFKKRAFANKGTTPSGSREVVG